MKKENIVALEELTNEELETVSGGLNLKPKITRCPRINRTFMFHVDYVEEQIRDDGGIGGVKVSVQR